MRLDAPCAISASRIAEALHPVFVREKPEGLGGLHWLPVGWREAPAMRREIIFAAKKKTPRHLPALPLHDGHASGAPRIFSFQQGKSLPPRLPSSTTGGDLQSYNNELGEDTV